MRVFTSTEPVFTDVLPIRIRREEKDAIRIAAQRRGKTVSEFAREALAAAAAVEAA